MSWQSRKHKCRYEKAKEQYEKYNERPINPEDIFNYTKKCMEEMGIDTTKINSINDVKQEPPYDKDFYDRIMEKYELKDRRDIIWMKFTKSGHLGVVADSNDINFCIPKDESDYLIQDESGKWVYNFSGILVHCLGEQWNNDYVWVFPLCNLSELSYTRHYVEKTIGNNLIDNNVPILDYYSHRLG